MSEYFYCPIEDNVSVNMGESVCNLIPEFLKSADEQPLDKNDVSDSIISSVKKYLADKNLGKLVSVTRASNHPDDFYLYHVIAKKTDNTYNCWTSYNSSTGSMNHGYYGLSDLEKAKEICADNYNDAFKNCSRKRKV